MSSDGKAALTDREVEAIEAAAEALPRRRSASIDALRIVQAERGWIDDDALGATAEQLDMSRHELDAVATFYNLIFRRPVGRHVVHVCDSVSCWVMGGDRVTRALCRRLSVEPGERTDDGRFTVLPIQCLGACDGAPAMMIDEDLHRRVPIDGDALAALLEDYE